MLFYLLLGNLTGYLVDFAGFVVADFGDFVEGDFVEAGFPEAGFVATFVVADFAGLGDFGDYFFGDFPLGAVFPFAGDFPLGAGFPFAGDFPLGAGFPFAGDFPLGAGFPFAGDFLGGDFLGAPPVCGCSSGILPQRLIQAFFSSSVEEFHKQDMFSPGL